MRILKGYSKEEQKDLEYTKKNMSCNDLLHNIAYFPANIGCNPIKDILDFYTDKAKFKEQKYYVKLIRNNDNSYLNRGTTNNFCMACDCKPNDTFQTEFTEQEIKAIDPRYMAFAVPVEEVR